MFHEMLPQEVVDLANSQIDCATVDEATYACSSASRYCMCQNEIGVGFSGRNWPY